MHVAKLVTTPAAGTDADVYLSNIATQTLQLLIYGLFKNDKVCVSFFHTLRRNRRMQSDKVSLPGVIFPPFFFCF